MTPQPSFEVDTIAIISAYRTCIWNTFYDIVLYLAKEDIIQDASAYCAIRS